MSGRKVVFGDSLAVALAKSRVRLDEHLLGTSIAADGLRRRVALEADEAAIEQMRSAARPVVNSEVVVSRKKRTKRARVNTIAPSDYSGGFRVVYSGIDTYIVNIIGKIKDTFLLTLPLAQEDAKASGDMSLSPFPPFLGENLAIKPHGGGTFAFLLDNADMAVKVRKEDHSPALADAQVQLKAACLHRLGFRAALEALAAWVKVWAPGAKIQPSRVDLCADTQGWRPTLDDMKERAFVSPCSEPFLKLHGSDVNYLRFGTGGREGSRSGSAPVQFVVYDKSDEVRTGDKGWFYALWSRSEHFRADEDVIRVEARFTREWLRDHAVDSQAALLVSLGSLWGEGLEWCRYCVPPKEGEDSNRSRLEVRDEWRVLRSVDWSGSDGKQLERIDQSRPRLERTLAAIGGHFVTLQAMLAGAMVPDLVAVADMTVSAVLKRWDARGESYEKKVDDRVLRLGGLSLA